VLTFTRLHPLAAMGAGAALIVLLGA
jgi:hypothetical protein